jgi:hypothetical protein
MTWTSEIDQYLLIVRILLGILAVGLLVYDLRLAQSDRSGMLLRSRNLALGVLVAVTCASAYGFFVWRHSAGVQMHEFYHYYLNAKYFPELGYFDLYDCSVAALAVEQRMPKRVVIRDLRRFLATKEVDTRRIGSRCGERFSPERWRDFRTDIRYFDSAFLPGRWAKVLMDQGYNASPVWGLIGRPVASLVPATDAWMRALGRVDLVILCFSFAFVGWAFGFRVLCVAALVWAVNPLSRYGWIGDAFLRYAWFAAFVIGICLLRKQRHFSAGVLLATASLLRLFPAFFIAVYALGVLRRRLRGEAMGVGFRRFVAGAVLASVVLTLMAIPVSGRGPTVLSEFASNISTWSRIIPSNSVGLPTSLSYTSRVPEEAIAGGPGKNMVVLKQALRREIFAERLPVFLGIVALFMFLLWRAVEHAEDWQTACLGFVPILILLDTPVYYASFAIAPALLSQGQPRIGIGALLSMIGICIATLVWWAEPYRFAVASSLLLLLALFTLLELRIEGVDRHPLHPKKKA